MIQATILGILTTGSNCAPIIGGDIARVFPVIAPQKSGKDFDEFPFIVYSIAGLELQNTFCGTSNLKKAIIELDLYARTYSEVCALAAAARADLGIFTGDSLGVYIRNIALDTESDFFDAEPGIFRVMQNYNVWFLEG